MTRKATTAGLGVLTILTTITAVPSARVSAIPPYLQAWQQQYPTSLTDNNLANGSGTSCQLCHVSANGGEPWNAYGWQIRSLLEGGSNITGAILGAQSFDSDQDPTGASNLVEIEAHAQPGWTPGPNNTIFLEDGDTQAGQSPPPSAQGELDPPPSCVGDTNGDSRVDVQDLVNVVLTWGTNDAGTDINGDGIVDVQDLVGVVLAWGPC